MAKNDATPETATPETTADDAAAFDWKALRRSLPIKFGEGHVCSLEEGAHLNNLYATRFVVDLRDAIEDGEQFSPEEIAENWASFVLGAPGTRTSRGMTERGRRTLRLEAIERMVRAALARIHKPWPTYPRKATDRQKAVVDAARASYMEKAESVLENEDDPQHARVLAAIQNFETEILAEREAAKLARETAETPIAPAEELAF